jgi:hypothetical protein
MHDNADNGSERTGCERAEACWNQQPVACPDRNHDKDDFQTFQNHGFEARKPSEPIRPCAAATCFLAQFRRLGGKDRRFIMRWKKARGAPSAFQTATEGYR